jgi:hypothetical protein
MEKKGGCVSVKTWLLIAPNKGLVIKKEIIANLLSFFQEVYLVNEHPKSGATWLKFMLSDMLNKPAWTKKNPYFGSCVMQAHWMKAKGRCKQIVLFRDGRDVMVSYYYHCFFINEHGNNQQRDYYRNIFKFDDYEDIRTNLLPFMKVMLLNPITTGFTWMDFVNKWHPDNNVIKVQYEDLRSDTANELVSICRKINNFDYSSDYVNSIVLKYSIENMKDRWIAGNDDSIKIEKSFIRKGSVGGWSECFSDESLEWFISIAGRELTLLGYSLERPAS